MSGTYKRNAYTQAQKMGIENWAKTMNITGLTKKRSHVCLDDKQFREYRRKVEDLQDLEHLLSEAKEVWE